MSCRGQSVHRPHRAVGAAAEAVAAEPVEVGRIPSIALRYKPFSTLNLKVFSNFEALSTMFVPSVVEILYKTA